ncbi:MAG: tol-pal system protein YbgF [Nitrosomonadales bacterium]|jgi:tol-pal system protein YbgF
MQKLRALMLLGLCFASPARAVLFPDDDARKSIQQVEARVLVLEEQGKLQTKSIFDLQGQIDMLSGELRKLRGQNEETAHGLQDAEKREKDFYVDLDTRLRHFESQEAPAQTKVESAVPGDLDDPAAENRAIETAYSLFKAASYANAAKALQEFIKKYPSSVHMPNATYWLGDTQLALKDYKGALVTYRALLKASPESARTPDVLFNIAECHQEQKAVTQAAATLKQLVSKYPDSAAAAKAKKLLAK